MNIISLSIVAIFATFSAMPTLAQSPDIAPATASTSYTYAQSLAPVVYENPMVAKPAPAGVAMGQTPSPEPTAKALWNAFGVRTSALNMETSRTGVVMSDDHISLAAYAPMQAVNGALTLAGYISRSRLDDSLVTWVQILSLATRRQINTEFKYSVKVSNHSKFDSFITYRLNPASDPNRSSAAAGVRYNIKF